MQEYLKVPVQRRPLELTVTWLTKVKGKDITVCERATLPSVTRKRRSFEDAEEGQLEQPSRERTLAAKPPCDTRPVVSIRGKGNVMAPSSNSSHEQASSISPRSLQQNNVDYPHHQQQMVRSRSDYGPSSQHGATSWGRVSHHDEIRATSQYQRQIWGGYQARRRSRLGR